MQILLILHISLTACLIIVKTIHVFAFNAFNIPHASYTSTILMAPPFAQTPIHTQMKNFPCGLFLPGPPFAQTPIVFST